ncbi:MAG: hypothetical protein E7588_10235 [Ruminococcaceae bacterium]|nr:hypothetical protein [Oscillospiraceae bacterium]
MKRYILLIISVMVVITACTRTAPPAENEISRDETPVVPAFAVTDEHSSEMQDTPDPVVQDVPDAPQVKTDSPVISEYHNTEPDLISIGGSCENNSEIILKSDEETVKIKSNGEHFLAQIRIPSDEENTDYTIEITACTDGKAPADTVTLTARYLSEHYVYDDDWHILLSDTSRGFARLSFADFEGTNLMSEKQLELFKKRINDKTALLAEEVPGCKLVYMIVPNPLTIYAEEAPKCLIKAKGLTKMDQVLEAISQTDAYALDLRPVLREHRNDELQPYLHTDSHWSEYGSYLGLSVLCDFVSRDFPEAAIRPVEQYGFENRLVKGGDVVYYLGMDNTKHLQQAPFFNPEFELPVTAEKYLDDSTLQMDFNRTSSRITISTGNQSLPDCVVFRDSYGVALYEILPDRFNNTSYYYTWGYNFDMNYIKNASPDYVIYIIAERNLDSIIK